jgi:aryl-alcohol dehydrogenase-like predicted oxidoreductase
VAAVALRWLLDVPGITAPIVGARSVAQLEQSLACAAWTLGPEDWKAIDHASRIEEGYPTKFIRTMGG